MGYITLGKSRYRVSNDAALLFMFLIMVGLLALSGVIVSAITNVGFWTGVLAALPVLFIGAFCIHTPER